MESVTSVAYKMAINFYFLDLEEGSTKFTVSQNSFSCFIAIVANKIDEDLFCLG